MPRSGITAPFQRTAMLQILTSEADGVLRDVVGMDAPLRIPEVVDVQVFKSPGDRVRAYRQAAHELGYLMVVADTGESPRRARDTALETLRAAVSLVAMGALAFAIVPWAGALGTVSVLGCGELVHAAVVLRRLTPGRSQPQPTPGV
ncbi:hypothetical protein [Streptosporangium sp. NBC_01469]|uniref:hypothetical protein n=1 Tax=Streptosporangium sp. NBC_01469 TaxID=2903898 RepID=UPI002E29ADA2|nr:hypothetical protein [Streptosporangium sp. NBC_01469]